MSEDTFRNTITLTDAARMTGPSVFNIMIKPCGSVCNLDCRYCYYLDKASLYGGHEPKMSDELLEKIIKDYAESVDMPEITFNWHGGEPLVAGIDFYRKAVALERKYCGDKLINNTLQTNGTLVDSRWADFFAENRFLVGISIDGPQNVHDRFRSSKSGEPSFRRVMDGLLALRRAGVEFNTLTTVSKASEGHGAEIYSFLKAAGSHYMQFLPVVEKVVYPRTAKSKPDYSARPSMTAPESDGDGIATWSVDSIAYGKFLCEIFDIWVKYDVGKYFVGMFDSSLAGWCGVPPGSCTFTETCGNNLAVEHNGDVYVCDHYVYPRYRLGNVRDSSLRDLAASSQALQFGIDKRNTLPRECRRCEFLNICHGGCPQHRLSRASNGEAGKNSLCEGLKMFWRHSAPAMQKMRELLAQNRAPSEITGR